MNPFFDNTTAYYDDWRRRHTNYGRFVAFETGEIVMPFCGEIDTGSRGRRDTKLNIDFDASTDPIRRTAYFTPDGEPLKRAWLHPGTIQTFLLDWCTETAVAIDTRGAHATNRGKHPPSEAQWAIVPEQFRDRATVYWPAAGEQPIGAPVWIRQPRKLTTDEREHIRTVTAACKAWHEFGMSSDRQFAKTVCDAELTRRDKRYVTAGGYRPTHTVLDEASRGINASLLLNMTFADMADYNRLRTAVKVEGAVEKRAFTHLKIKQMEG
jgi:hypothetical protein